MSSDHQARAFYLLQQVQQGTASAEEYRELLDLVDANAEAGVVTYIRDYFESNSPPVPEMAATEPGWQSMLQQIVSVDKLPVVSKSETPRIPFLRNWSWAAAAVLLLAAGAWLWLQNNTNNTQQLATVTGAQPIDVPAGKSGAVLTLANGQRIILDSLGDGTIANQQGSNIALVKGQLLYKTLPNQADGESLWNTMSTPRGRQFQLLLPDGSKVWLNAASSIRFPVAFGENERKVELTGEAYFEIAKNEKAPFRVSVNQTEEVEVLGTHFNINAYPEEGVVRTTLLEGLVRVSKGSSRALLHPGQQAISRQAAYRISDIDTGRVMAWKNGLFDFRDARFEEVMRQLARWYAIEVVYENGVPELEFGGKLGRDVSLSKVLVFFRESGIDCRIESGNRLMISKK